jgi:hypothetical protein
LKELATRLSKRRGVTEKTVPTASAGSTHRTIVSKELRDLSEMFSIITASIEDRTFTLIDSQVSVRWVRLEDY